MVARVADAVSTRRRPVSRLLLFMLTVGTLAVVLSACGDDASPPPGVRALKVRGPGGAALQVAQMGKGPVALVLAHGYGTTKSVWYPAMDDFTKAGYRVYALDSRGVGDSEGTMSGDAGARAADIATVVRYARNHGAEQVVVMGSSLGAEAAMRVARQDDLAAVVGISPATIPGGLADVTEPAFFVASEGDRGPAANARELGRRFDRPAEIVSGSVHGADLFLDHQEAIDAVLDFLADVAPPTTTHHLTSSRRARLTRGTSASKPAPMATAHHGDVELYFEEFGAATDPTLLLVNGFGSQCINYDGPWCQKFAAQGYRVVRFDNRDVGLSSKLEGRTYALRDMAADAVAVLDALNVDRAHVIGVSMGGMISQRLAIDHGDRVRSLTSVMSTTGEPEYGRSSPEALAMLMAEPATTRDEYVDLHIAALRVYGSKPEWIDEPYLRARAARAFDRCYCPPGLRRQMQAIMRDSGRADGLRSLTVPTLVMHGDRDTLIDPSGGRRTAELIPGARYVEIEGMGHDYPVAVWSRWVGTWADFARSVP